jgi:Lipoprotein LpqB beta-propeller domain
MSVRWGSWRRGPLLAAALAGVIVTLTACAGVPEDSAPERVRAIGGAAAIPVQPPSPQPGADPRAIVLGFLQANVSSLPDHNAAKGFLTPEARNTWSDTTVTIVDSYQVKLPDPYTDVVTVTANQVGTLDQNGIYRAALPADSGAIQRSFSLRRVKGEWRIDKLSPGLMIQLSDFTSAYRMHPLYFFDLAQRRLVPDPRYSALSDQSLATWLLDQLLSPPRPELQVAVLSFPDAVNAKNATVTISASQLYVVELPGSSQLDEDSRRRLAAQVAYTFSNALVTITDNRRPVSIPGITGAFGQTDFQSVSGLVHDRSAFYLNDERLVVDETGKVLDGPLGHRSYGLTSIALAGVAGTSSDLRAAGTAGPAARSTVLIGTRTAGLHTVALPPAPMSRPAWAPGPSEVWLGYGSTLRRVVASGASNQVQITGRGSLTGNIEAVRFSPDGTRIALVIGGAGGVKQCAVGTVERSGANVRVDNLVPITPSALNVTDVAWNDGTTLYLTGSDSSGYGVWSVQSDGSAFSKRPSSNLPAAPDSIAAASGELPWVASGGGVFIQRSNIWTSPFGASDATVRGRSPVYLE